MNWKNPITEPPRETGNCIGTVRRQREYGVQLFTDAVYYDAESKKWFKYDPFDDDYEPKEEITVTGWVHDLGVYQGSGTY